ncbi:MFS general substrate transporter [Coniochaeta ligniaria NRRL 30616]|uniref:MFS general substrate transporter n=1 Tax=Coniochaeta ligniaria NRRL 30616 TaxID=1408157 RepID=A0A1J7J6U1_9PEZI|nr:MFS general substrate transporter [Coniochaeta ligniaria NRRL 30616]
MSGSEVLHVAAVPDRGPAVFAVTTATLILASVFVAGRMFSRARIVRHVSADDYIICVAWLIALFLSMTIDLAATRGLGRHDANISKEKMPGLRKCEYVFSVLYNPALMATKTSILVFYLRLAKNTQKILRMASWTCLVIVNLAGGVLTLLNIFQCRPVAAAWNPYVVGDKCIPLLTEFVCSAPVNIVTDLAILALPIPVLTGMRLPQRQKIILVLTFSFGIFVTVVDVVRIYYLQQAISFAPTTATNNSSGLFGDTLEFSWNASLSLMWSAVEVNVGITIACVPMLKPLILKILPAMLYDPDGTRSRTRNLDSKYALEVTPQQDSTDNNTAPALGEPLTAPHEPPPAMIRDIRDSDEVSIRDFLARGDSVHPADQHLQRGTVPQRASTVFGSTTQTSTQENSVYFGFVNMKRPRSMLRTSVPESWKYCTAVTILFFLWGFSYGLLNTLNNAIAAIANMTEAQTLGLTSIYFGAGYFFGPLLVGEWLVRHDEHQRSARHRKSRDYTDNIGGFRTTFIVGLLIYGTGTMAFWPSAVLTAFGGFMVSNFIVGFGLGVLETAANPFIALCGPMQYSEMRLCLAQGVQAVGSVLSGLLAQRVFFVDLGQTDYSSTSLLDIQWTYLAITLFCVLLALFFYYMPLPEVSDAELELLASKLPVDPKKRSIGGFSLRNWTIVLAVTAQWTYIAAQESMSIYFGSLLTELLPASTPTSGGANDQTTSTSKPAGLNLSIPDYLLVAHTAFAVSRFAAGYLSYLSVRHPSSPLIPTPRTMLTASALLSALFALLVVVLRPHRNANLLVIPVVLFFLAEGPLWPLIFAMGLRGQGKRTKRAGAWLTMGASGPAFWPFVLYGIVRGGGSLQTAFVVVVVLLVFTFIYPVFLTVVRDARMLVDVGEGKGGGVNVDDVTGMVGGVGDDERAGEDLDAVVAERHRAARKGGVFGRFSRGGIGEERKGSGQTGSPPLVEEGQEDAQQPQQLQQRQREPWETQELDTTILEEP